MRIPGSRFAPHGRNGSRRGFTLVEMLVVVAVGSVIVAIAVGLILTVFEVERRSRHYHAGMSTLARLADQLRRDAHAAVAFSPVEVSEQSGGHAEWEFQMDGARVVRYQAGEAAVDRTELAEGKVVRRETYRLPHGLKASLEATGDEPLRFVCLRIVRTRIRPKSIPFQDMRIEAALAADQRFQLPERSPPPETP